jgi:hypothetical protein
MFIATDGLTDQIGGPKKIAFGKRKAFDTIGRAPHPVIERCLRSAASGTGRVAGRADPS